MTIQRDSLATTGNLFLKKPRNFFNPSMLVFLVFFLGFAGCKKKSAVNIKPVTFAIDSLGSGKVKFEKKLSFLPLTVPDGIISYIDKLYYTDQYVIIFDKYSVRVTLFDHQGNYVRDIGPGKDASGKKRVLNDVNFYERTGEVEFFSLPERKLWVYDLNGKLKKEVSSKFDFLTFYKTAEGYWVYGCFDSNIKRSLFTFSKNKSNLLLLSDDLQTIKESFCDSENFFDRINSNDNFHVNSRGELYFYYGYNDVIYRIQGENVQPAFYLNFGQEKLPYDYLKTITNRKEFDDEVYLNKQQYPGFKSRMQIGDSHFSFVTANYAFGLSQPSAVICSTVNHQVKISGVDVVTSQPLLSNPVGMTKGKMFFMINPRLLNEADKNKLRVNYNLKSTELASALLFFTDEKNVI